MRTLGAVGGFRGRTRGAGRKERREGRAKGLTAGEELRLPPADFCKADFCKGFQFREFRWQCGLLFCFGNVVLKTKSLWFEVFFAHEIALANQQRAICPRQSLGSHQLLQSLCGQLDAGTHEHLVDTFTGTVSLQSRKVPLDATTINRVRTNPPFGQ